MNEHKAPDLDPADPEPPLPEAGEPAPRDAAARPAPSRFRLLTLAEVLGVAGLAIAGLTLWNNVAMRQGQESERVADADKAARAAAEAAHDASLVTLEGQAIEGGKHLKLSDVAGHRLQNVQVRFPPALGIATKGSVLDLQIDAAWIAKKIITLTDGGPDSVEGSVPVLITSSYWQGDKPVSDSAVYDLIFSTRGNFLSGRSLHLRGLVLVERVKPGTGAGVLAPRWQAARQQLVPPAQ